MGSRVWRRSAGAAPGGPFEFSPTKPGKTLLRLAAAHHDLKISPQEFDEVAAELGRSLDFANVPRAFTPGMPIAWERAIAQ